MYHDFVQSESAASEAQTAIDPLPGLIPRPNMGIELNMSKVPK